MADDDQLKPLLDRHLEIGLKANGAALTLSAVAASNIFSGTPPSGWSLVIPSFVFLAGLVLAYAAMLAAALQTLHFENLGIALRERERAALIQGDPAASSSSLSFAEMALKRAEEVDRVTEKSEKQLPTFYEIVRWSQPLSLACFVIGTIWGLVVIGSR